MAAGMEKVPGVVGKFDCRILSCQNKHNRIFLSRFVIHHQATFFILIFNNFSVDHTALAYMIEQRIRISRTEILFLD